eukprot:439602-Amorphochlora_amoeboformis.AAC.2
MPPNTFHPNPNADVVSHHRDVGDVRNVLRVGDRTHNQIVDRPENELEIDAQVDAPSTTIQPPPSICCLQMIHDMMVFRFGEDLGVEVASAFPDIQPAQQQAMGPALVPTRLGTDFGIGWPSRGLGLGVGEFGCFCVRSSAIRRASL